MACRLDELQPHPSYVGHLLRVSASKLSALIARDDLAFREPIVITRDLKVIDGYARLALARQQGRDTILCIEHELSVEEALRWLIQTHLPSRGLNAYGRTLLALDLEQSLKDKARANQQSGGRNKGSSNLTEAKSLDVRSEIAGIARVSTGNVTKVKQFRESAHPEVEQAVRTGEISIHRAWQWSRESHKTQLENLRIRRVERGIRKRARELVAGHRAKILPSAPDPPSTTLTDLMNLASRLSTMSTDESAAFGRVDIATLDVSGKAIYLTKELVQAFRPPPEGFAK